MCLITYQCKAVRKEQYRSRMLTLSNTYCPYAVVVSAKIAQSSKLIFVVFQEVMLQNKIRISTEYGSFFLKAGVNKIQNTANINCFPHDIIS